MKKLTPLFTSIVCILALCASTCFSGDDQETPDPLEQLITDKDQKKAGDRIQIETQDVLSEGDQSLEKPDSLLSNSNKSVARKSSTPKKDKKIIRKKKWIESDDQETPDPLIDGMSDDEI